MTVSGLVQGHLFWSYQDCCQQSVDVHLSPLVQVFVHDQPPRPLASPDDPGSVDQDHELLALFPVRSSEEERVAELGADLERDPPETPPILQELEHNLIHQRSNILIPVSIFARRECTSRMFSLTSVDSWPDLL